MKQALSNKIKLKSYSKVNFALWIKDKRQDGFHELESIFYEHKGLYDEVEVAFVVSEEMEVNVTFVQGELNAQIMKEDNIAYKAAIAYLNKIGVQGTCNIKINKSIPMQAGLGGGSSNAGAVLKGLNQLFENRLQDSELISLSNEIGSDVPFFIYGGTCLVTGKGEKLKTIANNLSFDIKVVKPEDISISTKWAYEQLDLKKNISNHRKQVDLLLTAMQEGNYDLFFSNVFNDFENVMLKQHPQMLEFKEMLLNEGYSKAMLCGSGSAVFGIKEVGNNSVFKCF